MNKVISIFSGGGGIDLGFKLAGFDILFASDFNKDATETLKCNKSAKLVIKDDIRNLDYSEMNSDIHASAEYRASLVLSAAQKAVANCK